MKMVKHSFRRPGCESETRLSAKWGGPGHPDTILPPFGGVVDCGTPLRSGIVFYNRQMATLPNFRKELVPKP